MRSITPIIIILSWLVFLSPSPSSATVFSTDTLVDIDGASYSTDDFKRWWNFWKDEDSNLPDSPEPYIDFLLLSREAKKIQLDDMPEFKRRTSVFIQARSLPILQYEEIFSQINITDEDVKAHFETQYLPAWLMLRLEFEDEESAMAAWRKLSEGTMTLENLLASDPGQNGFVDSKENLLRPINIDPGWVSILEKLSVGELIDPNEYGKGRVLHFLKEIKGFDEEQFLKIKERLRNKLFKDQQHKLTLNMIHRLRDKYQVNINKERLEALDLNAPDETFTDAPVITSNKQNVSEKQFIAITRKVTGQRPSMAHALADPEKVFDLKMEIADNIIGQSVTDWESLDRHFEKKEPFKWSYEFNYNYRLVSALESHILLPDVKEPSEEQIKQFYEENSARYTQPEMVKIYIFDETQGPIDKIWADVTIGQNFEQAVKAALDKELSPEEVPANHLDPEVKKVVKRLIDGETSQIFTAQGTRVMVHLVKRTPKAMLPLDRVKKTIQEIFRKKEMSRVRDSYLDTIKSFSKINIQMSNWEKIQNELGEK